MDISWTPLPHGCPHGLCMTPRLNTYSLSYFVMAEKVTWISKRLRTTKIETGFFPYLWKNICHFRWFPKLHTSTCHKPIFLGTRNYLVLVVERGPWNISGFGGAVWLHIYLPNQRVKFFLLIPLLGSNWNNTKLITYIFLKNFNTFQTWFFTDSYDPDLLDRTNGHLIRTNCSESHSREALTCKMAAEFDSFLQSHKP